MKNYKLGPTAREEVNFLIAAVEDDPDLVLYNLIGQREELIEVLVKLLKETNGKLGQNPYTHPVFTECLKTIKEVRGFDCDWRDVLEYLEKEDEI